MRITGYRLYLTRRDPAHSIIYDYRVDGVPENLPSHIGGESEMPEAINRLMGDILLYSSSLDLAPLREGWREVSTITVDIPDTTARNANYIALDIEGVGTRYYFINNLVTVSSGKCLLQIYLDIWASYHEYLSRCRGAISRAHVDRYRKVDNAYYPILNPYDDPLTDGIAVHTTSIKPQHKMLLTDNEGTIINDDTQIVWIYRKLNVNLLKGKDLPESSEQDIIITGIDHFSTGLPVVATPLMAITNFSDPPRRSFYPVTIINIGGGNIWGESNPTELGESSSLYINSWLSLTPPIGGEYTLRLIDGEVMVITPSYGSIRVLGNWHSITADNVPCKLSPLTIISANQWIAPFYGESIIDTIGDHLVTLSDIESGEAPESKIHGMGYDEHGFMYGDIYCPFDYSRPEVFSTYWYTRYGEYPVSDIVVRDIDGHDEIIKTIGFMPTSTLPTSIDQAELFLRSSGESYYLAKANAKRDASVGIGSGIFKGITKALTAKNVGGVIGGVSSAIGAGISGGIKLSDIERNHEAKMADLGNALDAITVPSRNSIEALSYNADILLKVEKSVDPESRDRITRTWRLKGYPVNLFGDVIRRNRKWFDYVSAIDLTPPSFDGFTPDQIPLASEFDRFAVAMSRGVTILHIFTDHDHPRPGGEGLGDWAIAPPSDPFDSMANPERSLI